MEIPVWLASNAILVVLIGIAMWLARKFLAALIAESVKADFNASLENLRSELRIREEGIRAELRTKEAEISALQESGLVNVRNSQDAIMQRRLKAVDDLWKAVDEFNRFNGTLMCMTIVNTGDLWEQVDNEPRTKAFVDALAKASEKDFENAGKTAASARPFLPDLAWALYQAYTTLFAITATQAKLAAQPALASKLVKSSGLNDILTKALPHWTDHIASHGVASYYNAAEELRKKILAELRSAVAGHEQDAEGVKRASAVMAAVDASRKAQTEQQAKIGAS